MKFKFAYETLLRHRQTKEDIARRDYLEALSEFDFEMAKFTKMTETLHSAIQERFEQSRSGGNVSGSLNTLDEFIQGQKVLIDEKKKVLAGLKEIVDEKQGVLVEAARGVKVLEKLKEKQLAEFKREKDKAEVRQMDDLTVMRFRLNGEQR